MRMRRISLRQCCIFAQRSEVNERPQLKTDVFANHPSGDNNWANKIAGRENAALIV